MTEQEAKVFLELAVHETDSVEEDAEIRDIYKEMCKVSIKALEKQIPMKPIDVKKYPGSVFGSCPICQRKVITSYYCPKCGQRLDWSDE